MRLIVRKALNFVNRDDQQSSKNTLGQFTKKTKIESLESLNADFFQFSPKSFVLSSWLGIRH